MLFHCVCIMLLPAFIHTQTEILHLTKNSGIRPSIALNVSVCYGGGMVHWQASRGFWFFFFSLSVQINVHVRMVARHSSSVTFFSEKPCFVHLLESSALAPERCCLLRPSASEQAVTASSVCVYFHCVTESMLVFTWAYCQCMYGICIFSDDERMPS